MNRSLAAGLPDELPLGGMEVAIDFHDEPFYGKTDEARTYSCRDRAKKGTTRFTAMGSDAEEKQELDAGVFAAVDLIACDSRAQVLRLGELHHAYNAGVIDDSTPVVELGEITAGAHPGRVEADAITICDLTGTGMQDTVIANRAYQMLSGV